MIEKEDLKKATESDVDVDIPFLCKIGKVKATIGVLIEPDPHGDGKGIHAHFHTTIRCPMLKVVDLPEPDRCQVIDSTCPFWEPFGSYDRDPSKRRWLSARKLFQSITSVEHYGTQLVNMIFKSKNLRLKSHPRFIEVNRRLMASNIIDQGMYIKLEMLRKQRNTLAHDPEGHIKFKEEKLFELTLEANKMSSTLRRLMKKLNDLDNVA